MFHLGSIFYVSRDLKSIRVISNQARIWRTGILLLFAPKADEFLRILAKKSDF